MGRRLRQLDLVHRLVTPQVRRVRRSIRRAHRGNPNGTWLRLPRQLMFRPRSVARVTSGRTAIGPSSRAG